MRINLGSKFSSEQKHQYKHNGNMSKSYYSVNFVIRSASQHLIGVRANTTTTLAPRRDKTQNNTTHQVLSLSLPAS